MLSEIEIINLAKLLYQQTQIELNITVNEPYLDAPVSIEDTPATILHIPSDIENTINALSEYERHLVFNKITDIQAGLI